MNTRRDVDCDGCSANTRRADEAPLAKRLAWMIAIWAASVGAVWGVSVMLRWWLSGG